MGDLLPIFFGVIFVNNLVLIQFLGICPFMGVSKKVDTSIGMGMAVTFVMTLAAVITWMIHNWILVPFGIEYLQTVSFILVIASLVQFVEMAVEKISPSLYQSLGVFLPLITTNCAIMGLALLNITNEYSLLESAVHGVGGAIGFTIALLLIAGIREQLELAKMNDLVKGISVAFIVAGVISVAFLGFEGVV
ncbi:electron transport complex subunit RsxA [Natranaerofaba carboxydovora]|uniref:electron transport complex subunit RsxA n=1 Tax=Natranaerofaba carboxydovora TaxID=2742683 RepID=UPI001F143E97|nr:electron transport complex subunit RsxA [Natranaerofaba carboxydovora]UMZ72849.1 Electron transport complex subunit RsxA [Natranaerofaba carboxydovora]